MKLLFLTLLFLYEVSGSRKVTVRRISKEPEDKEVDAADVEEAQQVIEKEVPFLTAAEKVNIMDLSINTSPTKRLKIAKTRGFKKIWPKTCGGHNRFGEKLHMSTNGFICNIKSKDHEIAEIYSLRWVNEHSTADTYVCCAGECQHGIDVGPACAPKKLHESAHIAAMAVTELETARGQKVEVFTIMAPHWEVQEIGLLATVEVRMMDGVLAFLPARPNLTESGQMFLDDLGDPLAGLLSMQMTGFEGQNLKLHFCPHGSTTATEKNARDPHLCENRANLVGDALKKVLPEATATVGAGIGHFKHEDENHTFIGGRFGSIVYKIYDADIGTVQSVECKREDLYPFMEHIKGIEGIHSRPKRKNAILHPEELEEPKPEVTCDNPSNEIEVDEFPGVESIRAKSAPDSPLDLERIWYVPGAKIDWSCPAGYRRQGAPSSTCQDDGDWDYGQALCDPVYECNEPCATCIPAEFRRGKGKDCQSCVPGLLLNEASCIEPYESFSGTWVMNNDLMNRTKKTFKWFEDKKYQVYWNSTRGKLKLRVMKYSKKSSGLLSDWEVEEPRTRWYSLTCKAMQDVAYILTCVTYYNYKSVRSKGAVKILRKSQLFLKSWKGGLQIIARDRKKDDHDENTWVILQRSGDVDKGDLM